MKIVYTRLTNNTQIIGILEGVFSEYIELSHVRVFRAELRHSTFSPFIQLLPFIRTYEYYGEIVDKKIVDAKIELPYSSFFSLERSVPKELEKAYKDQLKM